MDTAHSRTQALERCFAVIAERRMDGVPILNPALHVRAVGMRAVDDGWLCTLVTPWFMNLMLLPTGPAGGETAPERAPERMGERARVGDKRLFPFPAGRFEFIHGFEPAIGPYWMCSLFSPMFEFADQETAETAAAAALEALFEDEEEASAREREMSMIWRGEKPAAAAAAPEETASADAEEQVSASEDSLPSSPSGSDEPAAVSRRAFLRGGRPTAGEAGQ